MLLAEDTTTIGIVGAVFGGLAGILTAGVGIVTIWLKYRASLNELNAKREGEKEQLESNIYNRLELAYKEYILALKDERDQGRIVLTEYREALSSSQDAEYDCESEMSQLREYLHLQREALQAGREAPPIPAQQPRRKKAIAEFKARQAQQADIEATKIQHGSTGASQIVPPTTSSSGPNP